MLEIRVVFLCKGIQIMQSLILISLWTLNIMGIISLAAMPLDRTSRVLIDRWRDDIKMLYIINMSTNLL